MDIADFHWENQGGSTITQSAPGQPAEFEAKVNFSDNWRLLAKACPQDGPWIIQGSFGVQNVGQMAVAIFLGDPVTGRLLLFGPSSHEGLRVMCYASPQQWVVDQWNMNVMGYLPVAKLNLAISCDSGNMLHFLVSIDGVNYSELFKAPLTAWTSNPGQCGFAVCDCGPTPTTVTVFDFQGP